MHEKKSKHFSFYIGAQLLSVFIVLAVAFSVGYVSKESHVNFRGLLAQTLMTSDSSLLLPGITFSVLPTSLTKCESHLPRTQVIFSASDVLNGEFLVSSNTTSTGLSVPAGDYYFPNGTYHWYAVVKSGYVGSGPLYGDFVLNSVCPTTSTTSTGTFASTTTAMASSTATLSSASTVIPPISPIPTPLLTVFVDNIPITDREHIFSNGEVEFRIKAPLSAKRITLFAASSSQVELGRAVRDDLLSNEKFDVWSFIWNVEKAAPGAYKVFARIVTSDNHFPETAPVMMSIVHKIPVTSPQTPDRALFSRMSDGTDVERQEEILSRVTTPSLCMNREECQVYCTSHAEEKKHCTLFARTMLDRSLEMPPSLTDGIDPLRIQIVLDNHKRSKEIPEEVSTPEKLKEFCAELSHADVCAKVLVRNDLANETILSTKKELLVQIRNEEERIFTERIGARVFVDSDMDGIADYDEVNIHHTDPNNQDSDNDGFPDGAEIIVHTNPLGGKSVESGATTTSIVRDEFVKLENPHLSGAMSPKLLAVEEVSLVQTSPSENEHASSSALVFKGHATPNSFITLYIFSDPIVVTIKTDEFGAWTYTLDKALLDGSHEIYSAITDSGGHILAKSEPLPFVKEAQAVSFGSAALLPGNTEPGFFSGASLYAFIAIIIGILGIAFSIIGFMVRRRDVENIPIE